MSIIKLKPKTTKLEKDMAACTICSEHLPLGPRPVFSFSSKSKILLVGQAPGIRVHESGVPWNDPSGVRLRQWLGVSENQFYDTDNFAIAPMAFCYPGTGKSGDLPPRPECAPTWMPLVKKALKRHALTIVIGQYAHRYFLGKMQKKNLTETVRAWRDYRPKFFVLPHPSPRNNIWIKKNPWFDRENRARSQKGSAITG